MYPPSETTGRFESGVASVVVVEGETEVVDKDVGACDGRLGASLMAASTALEV